MLWQQRSWRLAIEIARIGIAGGEKWPAYVRRPSRRLRRDRDWLASVVSGHLTLRRRGVGSFRASRRSGFKRLMPNGAYAANWRRLLHEYAGRGPVATFPTSRACGRVGALGPAKVTLRSQGRWNPPRHEGCPTDSLRLSKDFSLQAAPRRPSRIRGPHKRQLQPIRRQPCQVQPRSPEKRSRSCAVNQTLPSTCWWRLLSWAQLAFRIGCLLRTPGLRSR